MGMPNGMYVSQDGGKKFKFRAIPQMEYPPIYADQDGFLIGVYWYGRNVIINDNGSMEVEQTLVFRNKQSGAVDFDKPVIWRLMVSNDVAVSWYLKDYKVLRPDDITNHTSMIMEKKIRI